MPEELIDVQLPTSSKAAGLLDSATLGLIAALHDNFAPTLANLLAERENRQAELDRGTLPRIESEAAAAPWRIAGIPQDLRDRRLELHLDPNCAELPATSGISTVVVNFDVLLPVAGAALNAHDSLLRLCREPDARLALVFGPRAISSNETALRRNGVPVNAALVDVALFLRHHCESGNGLYLLINQLGSVNEAAFWTALFRFVEARENINPGRIRATLGIESVAAVCAVDAILYELRDYAVALAGDRYAYLRNFARSFRRFPQFLLPDRTMLGGNEHFLRCRGLLLIQTAHRHGASALAPTANYFLAGADSENQLIARMRAEKERHAHDGFDGSGIVDAAITEIVREVIERLMPGQHQQHRLCRDTRVTAADLVQIPKGKITEQGMRANLRIATAALLAWDRGETVLALNGMRETRHSVEFAALQLGQWVRHDTGVLDDGRIIDEALFLDLLADESSKLVSVAGELERAQAQIRNVVLKNSDAAELFPDSA